MDDNSNELPTNTDVLKSENTEVQPSPLVEKSFDPFIHTIDLRQHLISDKVREEGDRSFISIEINGLEGHSTQLLKGVQDILEGRENDFFDLEMGLYDNGVLKKNYGVLRFDLSLPVKDKTNGSPKPESLTDNTQKAIAVIKRGENELSLEDLTAIIRRHNLPPNETDWLIQEWKRPTILQVRDEIVKGVLNSAKLTERIKQLISDKRIDLEDGEYLQLVALRTLERNEQIRKIVADMLVSANKQPEAKIFTDILKKLKGNFGVGGRLDSRRWQRTEQEKLTDKINKTSRSQLADIVREMLVESIFVGESVKKGLQSSNPFSRYFRKALPKQQIYEVTMGGLGRETQKVYFSQDVEGRFNFFFYLAESETWGSRHVSVPYTNDFYKRDSITLPYLKGTVVRLEVDLLSDAETLIDNVRNKGCPVGIYSGLFSEHYETSGKIYITDCQ